MLSASQNLSSLDGGSSQELQLAVNEKMVGNAASDAQDAVFNTLNNFLPKQLKTEKKKKEEAKIRYAKEFFVTERGEVIKMGAIITPNPHIRGKLLMAK